MPWKKKVAPEAFIPQSELDARIAALTEYFEGQLAFLRDSVQTAYDACEKLKRERDVLQAQLEARPSFATVAA